MKFFSTSIIGVIGVLLLTSGTVSALTPITLSDTSSYVWHTIVPRQIFTHGLELGRFFVTLARPHVSIRYRAQVKNADTGAIYQCGSSVPKGTRLALEFVPHQFDDVYWFTTGGNYDSPYGDWSANARPPAITCLARDYFGTDKLNKESNIDGNLFAALRVNPPQKTITGTASFTECSDTGNSSRTCKASTVGTAPLTFTFASTYGHFYARVKQLGRAADKNPYWDQFLGKCLGSNRPMEYSTGGPGEVMTAPRRVYKMDVPQYQVSCPITVTDVPATNTPPALTDFHAVGRCVINRSHTLSMSATDSDSGSQIRYIIDWGHLNSSGTWINDGTDIETTALQAPGRLEKSRTYTEEGTKSIKVKAIDNNGAESASRTITYTCRSISTPENTGESTAALCANNIDDDGDELIDGSDAECIGLFGDGSTGPAARNPEAVLSIRAIPSIVSPNDISRVHWSAINVTSCTVSAPNGDSWSEVTSPNATDAPPAGGKATKPIVGETIYTLSCLDLNGERQSRTATIIINPRWEETRNSGGTR